MFKVGDEVVLPLKIEKICNEELVGAKSEADVTYLFKIEEANRVLKPRESKTYAQGLADAWELVRKLGEIEQDEREKMFSYRSVKAIIEDCTIEEVMDKIEAYEKEKSEIKVGDVIKYDNNLCVVVSVFNSTLNAMFADGGTINVFISQCKKTGKHIEIESLLRQIGE